MTWAAVLLAAALAWDLAGARIAPWRRCRTCGGLKCARCRWVGKRPKLLARVVRRELIRKEGW